MTPTPGRLTCLSLQKVHRSMLVAAGAAAQLCRQGRSVSAVGEPTSCSDWPSAAAGQMLLLPTTCAAGMLPL